MWRLADQQLDTFIDRGKCEFLGDYAKPFSLLVIADLLGVPAEDHDEFRAAFASQQLGALGDESPTSHNPLEWLNDKFYGYIEDRRREPREDVLTELAQAKYPDDGSTPEIVDVMNLSTFLFAAGTETTTKLVSAAVRMIGENPEFETNLRDDRSRIPAFVEETLRMESPVKATSGWHARRRPLARSRCPPAQLSCCCLEHVTEMRGSSTSPTCSALTGATCVSTSRSSAASTRVPERRWRGRRDGSL